MNGASFDILGAALAYFAATYPILNVALLVLLVTNFILFVVNKVKKDRSEAIFQIARCAISVVAILISGLSMYTAVVYHLFVAKDASYASFITNDVALFILVMLTSIFVIIESVYMATKK